ncbi:biotin-dependent carboxyltransferase family protein [Mucilaginibacter limnophilus]|uniref:Biotin-dependent carboxyltransferase family protein n=1 Tax=Mucilaginibacter limnophilus TaxID=1932778 RepID=A0A437MFW7_9SPHI|nr:biotin-dependent carboxyltransferase family protein [Mucilaginibacter limnophilus]RVT96495.1 biotin-dependent carboxyltransferase family protein [Mucilaginibacter limnophilus]
MCIRIIKPGVLSTIQDMGRRQHLADAVPVSGAMDTVSARIANITLGNDSNCAVVELTYSGAVFFAETNLMISYAGEGSVLTVNGETLPKNKPVFIPEGNYIEQKPSGTGCRVYLAIAGGWDVPVVLGSRSTYLPAAFGGREGRSLQGGDTLESLNERSVITDKIFAALQSSSVKYPSWQVSSLNDYRKRSKDIRVVPGRESNRFNGESLSGFFTEAYTVSVDSNRMGINLIGMVLNRLNNTEMLSTAVTPGTIQVTNSGTAVILMADCQTTGGYPRIAQLASVDLAICGQLVPGDKIYFSQITWIEAEKLYMHQEEHLYKAALAIKHKYLY